MCIRDSTHTHTLAADLHTQDRPFFQNTTSTLFLSSPSPRRARLEKPNQACSQTFQLPTTMRIGCDGHYLLLPPENEQQQKKRKTKTSTPPEMKTARGPLIKGCLPVTKGDLLRRPCPPGLKPSEAAMSFGTLCTCTLGFPARSRRREVEGLSTRFEDHRWVPNKYSITTQPWKTPHATRSTVCGPRYGPPVHCLGTALE